MALIASYRPSVAGTPPTYGNAASGDTATIGDYLIVKNGSGSSITVTLATPGTLRTGDTYPDKVYTVLAAGEAWIPILVDYADTVTGQAAITWSSTTSVTRACVKAP